MTKTTIREDIAAVLGGGICFEALKGVRVVTHCLYPSFEQVTVLVQRQGDGFLITDDGGAASVSFAHGVDRAVADEAMQREARRHGLLVIDAALVVTVLNREWLAAAILSIANASAAAVARGVEANSAP